MFAHYWGKGGIISLFANITRIFVDVNNAQLYFIKPYHLCKQEHCALSVEFGTRIVIYIIADSRRICIESDNSMHIYTS